jgi:hypothetical protein
VNFTRVKIEYSGRNMKLAEIKVIELGPIAVHNMPCPVCREEHAVLDLSCGIMTPCRKCQKEGYWLVHAQPGSLFSWLIKVITGGRTKL